MRRSGRRHTMLCRGPAAVSPWAVLPALTGLPMHGNMMLHPRASTSDQSRSLLSIQFQPHQLSGVPWVMSPKDIQRYEEYIVELNIQVSPDRQATMECRACSCHVTQAVSPLTVQILYTWPLREGSRPNSSWPSRIIRVADSRVRQGIPSFPPSTCLTRHQSMIWPVEIGNTLPVLNLS